MSHISSYSEIYGFGHRAVTDIFDGDVVVEEKVDGSQFSFGIIDGELCARSKGKDIILDAPEKMFQKGIDTIKTLDLHEGWIYRGEYLNSPKHNTLSYLRVPNKHIIIFDIDTGNQCYLNREDKMRECDRIELECVPVFYVGKINSFDEIKSMLDNQSILGGCNIEGVVFKAYDRFNTDKKVLMGKYVNPEFQEKNQKDFKGRNPKSGDIINELIMIYKNENRWLKAIQHLRDNGELLNDAKDIGALIKEIKNDIIKEEEDNIKAALWKLASDKITRGAVMGFPEWYKERLIKNMFE